jgi:hypothetical protein
MDYQKANQFIQAITYVAGCVSAIQLIDAGAHSLDDETRMKQRVEYLDALKKHQKRIKDILTK